MPYKLESLAASTGLPKRDLALASRVLDALEIVGSYSEACHAEAERVLNLGVPLATMTSFGMVGKITDQGRSYLSADADTLEMISEIVAADRSMSVRDMWVGVNQLRAERAQ